MPEGRCNCASIKVSIPEMPKESAICYWYVHIPRECFNRRANSTAETAAAQARPRARLCICSTSLMSQSMTPRERLRATRTATRHLETQSYVSFAATVDGELGVSTCVYVCLCVGLANVWEARLRPCCPRIHQRLS